MDIILKNKLFTVLLLLIFRVVYSVIIYCKIDCSNKKLQNALTFLSFPFPIITGIICVVKYRKSLKDAVIILITLVVSLTSIFLISIAYGYNQNEKYYDKERNGYINAYDMSFIDIKGNNYTFNFDLSGYERLYINDTDEYLNADLCYINSKGFLFYDEDMSIIAKDETSCIDEDGSIYYPAKYTTFNKDGTIKYSFNSANFNYDRYGNAYTYNYVPYFDKEGNKYAYSFDSSSQQGYYTNISTKEIFDNENSFVDENGYFVYDKRNNFVKQEKTGEIDTYKDSSNKIYYWASSVSWDKEGNLLDSFGKIIKI